MAHTPTPWIISDENKARRVIRNLPSKHRKDCAFLQDAQVGFDHPRDCSCGSTIIIIESWTKEEDAAFIVQAVNSRDALVAALEAIKQHELLSTDRDSTVYDLASCALAAAKGGGK